MIFETSKVQQNEVGQDTIRTLTSQIDEQNEKIIQLTRESVEQAQVLATLKGKLDKCKELTERLELAENWRLRLKEALQEGGRKVGELGWSCYQHCS